MSIDHTANLKPRIFISSVQKELEVERMQLRITAASMAANSGEFAVVRTRARNGARTSRPPKPRRWRFLSAIRNQRSGAFPVPGMAGCPTSAGRLPLPKGAGTFQSPASLGCPASAGRLPLQQIQEEIGV